MRTAQEYAVSTAAITLMRGVVYREAHEAVWACLTRHNGPLRDHFGVLGVELVVDEVEGYAYLRTRTDQDDEPLPRLINRRSLSYPVSLMLVLLRKRLAEFEATSSEPRLVMTRDQLADLVGLFLPTSTNEARLLDQVDSTIKKVHELGFLRPLRGQRDQWEVRRILKAYVDAQTLSDFDGRLADYRHALGQTAPAEAGTNPDPEPDSNNDQEPADE